MAVCVWQRLGGALLPAALSSLAAPPPLAARSSNGSRRGGREGGGKKGRARGRMNEPLNELYCAEQRRFILGLGRRAGAALSVSHLCGDGLKEM